MPVSSTALPIAVLFSGRGSNLAHLLESSKSGRLPAYVSAAICNRASAAGLQHALQHALNLHIIDDRQIATWHGNRVSAARRLAAREDFEQRLSSAISASGAHWIVLAGFMRILTTDFIARHSGRIINLHPSLLPAYPGLDTHQRALAAGEHEYGASIHFVDATVDGGPVLAQYRMPVPTGASANSMAQALLPHEHRLLAASIDLLCRHQVSCNERHIIVDEQPLQQPLMLDRDLHWPG